MGQTGETVERDQPESADIKLINPR